MGVKRKGFFSTELITNHTVMSEEAPAVDEAPVDSKFEVPKLAEPKMDPNLDDFARMRLEKDLKELKRLIESHFEVRKKDEEELDALKDRIDKRKTVREKQVAERAIRAKKQRRSARRRRKRRRRRMLLPPCPWASAVPLHVNKTARASVLPTRIRRRRSWLIAASSLTLITWLVIS